MLLAKVGLDGHDRGIKIVARGLRDAGYHVIYGGIWQSPDAVAAAAAEEDADWLGLSLLSGAHMTLVPRVIDALRATGNQHTECLVGGIIPKEDTERLRQLGVCGVFGPGTSIAEIVDFLRQRSPQQTETVDLTSGVDSGDRVALPDRVLLGRLLSLIEQGGLSATMLNDLHRQRAGKTTRVMAFTGSAGVGKSSLIANLLPRLVQRDQRVAVLACDPQSPITGGALLGDRVRMSAGSDERVFIRSLAVPSGQQGIAHRLDQMLLVLAHFGFDLVLVESVGVGQGDVAIRQHVDRVYLLLQPESGDAIQWEKAGLLEIADMIVINKCDLPGADRLETELREQVNLPGSRGVPVVRAGQSEPSGWDEIIRDMTGEQ
ncbi:cobalamin-dependent protein [Stieleria maiorica]|uniref:cobalamin-dependent protein n=1 Tax=Stieleria maiorica TaxID=2795974 RepID=UPI001EEC45D4|nr:cobalamin-dependent protein [Stieleria maiorica]